MQTRAQQIMPDIRDGPRTQPVIGHVGRERRSPIDRRRFFFDRRNPFDRGKFTERPNAKSSARPTEHRAIDRARFLNRRVSTKRGRIGGDGWVRFLRQPDVKYFSISLSIPIPVHAPNARDLSLHHASAARLAASAAPSRAASPTSVTPAAADASGEYPPVAGSTAQYFAATMS